MRRRTFLELLAIGPVVAQASLAQEIVPVQPQRVLLTIAGIDARTAPDALGALLAALVAGGVPVNLVVETREGPHRIRPGGEIAQLIQRYLESFPGFVEVVAWCPDLGQLAPFQAARQAQETRKALFEALFSSSNAGHLHRPLLSIACKAPLDSNAASATLTSGFRNVLALPATDSIVSARLDQMGVLSLLGGKTARVQDAAAVLAQRYPGLQRHLIFSADEISRTPATALFASAQDIGRVLKDAALDLTMLSVLASDVQMRTETTFRRRVAVLVLDPADNAASGNGSSLALKRQLQAEGIPFSVGVAPRNVSDPDVASGLYWVPLALPQDGAFDPDTAFGAFAEERLAFAQANVIAEHDLRFGVVVRPVLDAGSAGLTATAEFNVPVLAFAGAPGWAIESGGFQLDTPGDGLLVVLTSSLQEPALRTAFVLAMRQILMQADTRLMSLGDYCAETLPKDQLLPALLLTRSKALRQAAGQTTDAAKERAALMEDARSAWAYFAQNTIGATGLCPPTTITKSQPTAGFLAVSMWEVGSHINALIAAVDLGLIPDEDFKKRCRQLLGTVERASRKRLVLPPETIDAESGKGTTRFNSYDTGRLMIALHRLNAHRLAPVGIDALVASWDFAKVILDRRLHSYRDRQMVADFASNYADYAAAGMRLWGFDVASPWDDFAGLTSADDEARLLAATVAFGVLGAEPCFLHLLEMQGSPTAAFLADCVDVIQSRLAEASGTPASPSETPLDRSPWFTYQGFDIRNLSNPWVVAFGAKGDDTMAETAALTLQATSTKAAFMWHALRPNRHSARLVETLRIKARKDFGFDSALYVTTQSTTAGYSDLNTNAVILQSIAHILRKAI